MMARPYRRLGLIVGVALLLFSYSPIFAAAPQPSDATNKLFSACQGSAANSTACPAPADKGTIDNPVNNMIKVAANIVALLTGVAAVVMIIVSGFSYVTSAGNTEKATSARRRILAAVIGLAVVALAWTLISFLTDKLVKT